MVWMVIIIALLNLAVGYAVAIYVERLRQVSAPSEMIQEKQVSPPPEVKPAKKPKPVIEPDDEPMLADEFVDFFGVELMALGF